MVTGRRMHGEERRRQILDVALDVFAEQGFHGARSREIARRAGVSETLVFRHFANKERLYEEALAHLFGGHDVAADIGGEIARADDHGVFTGVARHMLEHARRDARILRLHLFQVLDRMRVTGDDGGAALREGRLEALLTGYIARRGREGGLRAEAPELTAKLFLYWVFMAIADRELGLTSSPPAFGDAELADLLARRLLYGIAGGHDGGHLSPHD
ncbi:MAG: TetR/AcrR family transcriptional regulator [Rhodospirillales bacterium]|nr:TetR/AcrR family transcriptional regulator [Rhodospirillales bacterium]